MTNQNDLIFLNTVIKRTESGEYSWQHIMGNAALKIGFRCLSDKYTLIFDETHDCKWTTVTYRIELYARKGKYSVGKVPILIVKTLDSCYGNDAEVMGGLEKLSTLIMASYKNSEEFMREQETIRREEETRKEILKEFDIGV